MQCVHIKLPADRLSGIAPSARRAGAVAVFIVRHAAGSRRSVETVASSHCRNVEDHRMNASGLILRSGDHGEVVGSTWPVRGKRLDVDGSWPASRHDVVGAGTRMFRCRLPQGETMSQN